MQCSTPPLYARLREGAARALFVPLISVVLAIASASPGLARGAVEPGGSAASVPSPPPSGAGPAHAAAARFVATHAAAVARQDEPEGPGVLESEACALCHSNTSSAVAMRDRRGRAISPYNLWSSTMMANSARDPLWRAVVSAEVVATPSRKDDIERKCLSCHAPMGRVPGYAKHESTSFMHTLDCDGRLGDLARDGVSCTICHGIAPANLGTEESFSGHFELNDELRLFGPHQDVSLNPMFMNTGFQPTYSDHVTEAKLCATCHTLYTDTLDADGQPTGGRLLEQAPYLEWRTSIFSEETGEPNPYGRSCQDCHLPTSDEDGVPIETEIARAPPGFDFPFTAPRSPFGRHLLVGGNTFMLRILRDNAEELGVTAHESFFDATIEATREQLENRTAHVEIRDVERDAEELRFTVDVRNLTGHKLPTAHPIRRVWLRAKVRDAQGRLLFASGLHDEEGRLVDLQGRPLASELAGGPAHPHYDRITSPTEVATYEAIMADAEGAPTTTLLRGERWLVDDRLLPVGWSADHAEGPRTAPVGVDGDEDFVGGSDRVHYAVPVAEWGPIAARGPVLVEVELVHQPLSGRWASELFEYDTPEVKRFRRMFEAADKTPEVMAADQARVR